MARRIQWNGYSSYDPKTGRQITHWHSVRNQRRPKQHHKPHMRRTHATVVRRNYHTKHTVGCLPLLILMGLFLSLGACAIFGFDHGVGHPLLLLMTQKHLTVERTRRSRA